MTKIALLVFLLSTSLALGGESEAYIKLRASTLHLNYGSGSLVQGKSGKKYILTNAHVCGVSNYVGDIHASYQNGTSLRGDMQVINFNVDLCLTPVETPNPPLVLAKSFSMTEPIYTRGYPAGVLSESSGKVVYQEFAPLFFPIEEIGECPKGFTKEYGYHKILTGCNKLFPQYETTLYSEPGSSGSPIVNGNGELVGVMQTHAIKNKHFGGIIPFDVVKAFLDKY